MRYVLVAAAVLVVLGLLVGVKGWQISSLIAYGEKMEAAGPPPETVGSAVARAESWESTLGAVGTVAGLRSVTVSNDAPGIVKRIRFQSGGVARAGEVLVELDADVERGQLESARSRRDLARVNVRRTRNLVAKGAAPRAQLDTDQAQLAITEAEVASLEAQLERKVVRAPFAGRLGVRAVDLGEYLPAGTRVTELASAGAVLVDFTLPQERLAEVAVGMQVRVATRATGAATTRAATTRAAAEGTITAIGPILDPSTRSLQVRASVPDLRDELQPGMFVDVAVILPERASVVVVPATAIVHAAYGDSVFVIEGDEPVKVARQRFVRVGPSRGDFVGVTEGLEAGQVVVTAGAFKLRNGSRVVIDNGVQPAPRLDPRPENR